MWRIGVFLLAGLSAAGEAHSGAAQVPQLELSSEYTLPEERAGADLFRVKLEPTETTGTLAAPPTLTATVEFLGKGVCWQKYGNATDQLVLECVGGGEGVTSGSLTLLREETDRRRERNWVPWQPRRFGPIMATIFSGPDFPPEKVRAEYLAEPYGQIDYTNVTTAEELKEGQDLLAFLHQQAAQRMNFTGTSQRMVVPVAEWYGLHPGTWQFRVVFFAYPDVAWRSTSATPLVRRERVVSNIVTVHLLAEGGSP